MKERIEEIVLRYLTPRKHDSYLAGQIAEAIYKESLEAKLAELVSIGVSEITFALFADIALVIVRDDSDNILAQPIAAYTPTEAVDKALKELR